MEEETNQLTGNLRVSKLVEFLIAVFITIVVWNLPAQTFGIDGLTIVQQRVIAIFVFATFMWLTEAVPAWATSLAIITLMLLTTSNHSFSFFRDDAAGNLGTLLKSKDIMATFADPIIILFLGGFILAIAATKSGLDLYLAKSLLRPFGHNSEKVLLGFILITGINAVRETVHPLLGEKIPEEMVETVKKEVLEDKRILRIHDLIIHNYGEGRIYISLHAEINSDYSLIEAHEIIDDAERRVRNAFKCDITIHTDPVEIYDERYKELYKLVAGIIGQINVYNLANVSNTNKKDKENPMSYSMHDFHIHHSDKSKEELISFDLMVPEDFQGSPNKLKDYIKSEIRKSEPDLDVDIYVDRLYERIGF